MKKILFFLSTLFFTTFIYSQNDSTVREKEFQAEGQVLIPGDDYLGYAFYSSKGESGLGYFAYVYKDNVTLGSSIGMLYSADLNKRWEYEIGLGAGFDFPSEGSIKPTGIAYLYTATAAAEYRAPHKLEFYGEWYYAESYGLWTMATAMYSPFQKILSVGWHYQTETISGPRVAFNIADPVRIWYVHNNDKGLIGLTVDVGWERKKKR